MNENNKRAQLCGMDFLPIAGASINNQPGADYIRIAGTWREIPVSSGEWKETEAMNGIIAQELKVVVTNTSDEFLKELRGWLRQEGVVRLTFTNEIMRVVGTDQFPVLLTIEQGGSPSSLTLSMKRDSPEPAKLYQSF